MLFYSMFKTLVGKEIAVELKNDVALTGTLHSIDQYLNIKLLDARVVDAARHPQLVAVSSVFVRGSVVRYVQLPAADVDAEIADLLGEVSVEEDAPPPAYDAAAVGGAPPPPPPPYAPPPGVTGDAPPYEAPPAYQG